MHNDAIGPSIKGTLPTLSVSPPPAKTNKLTTKPYYSEPQSSSSYIYQQSLRKGQKPMRWLLITTDVPTRTVIQHTYPRIRDHELVNKPKSIPLEQQQLPESHYSTVYPPPITMDPRIFASPSRPNTQY